MLAQQGEVPPLNEIPAHHTDDGRVRPQRRPARLQQAQVAAVERIVFYDYTRGPHGFLPFQMTKKLQSGVRLVNFLTCSLCLFL